MRGNRLFCNFERVEIAVKPGVLQDGVYSVNQLSATTVVDRQVQAHTAILARCFHDCLKLTLDNVGERFQAPDRHELDVIVHQRGELPLKVAPKQMPETVDLMAGTLPVLNGESVQS